jgi:ribosome biogenesis GTPase / thiamine phosphate phosphatase
MVAGTSGVVLASYGRSALVQVDGRAQHCGLTGRKLRIVCGDNVTVGHAKADALIIETVQARRNLIERIDARGRPEPVASNLDCLAIVVAAEPQPDWFLVDRYWAGALLKDLAAILVINKCDLDTAPLKGQIAEYRRLGLPCFEVAARSGAGIAELKEHLLTRVSLMVGQSGVGKSSLVNLVAPDAAAQTAALTRDAEGRHTTTTARRYILSAGAAIVDAPGVRDFAPPASLMRAAERGFVEMLTASTGCRFKDCRHMEEPGCAVRTGVVNGLIATRRYESYRRLFKLYERLV